jgi:hypothetical protein
VDAERSERFAAQQDDPASAVFGTTIRRLTAIDAWVGVGFRRIVAHEDRQVDRGPGSAAWRQALERPVGEQRPHRVVPPPWPLVRDRLQLGGGTG